MKNPSNCQEIEMPLIIGLSQLKSHKKDSIKISTIDYTISIKLKNDHYLKAFIKKKNLSQHFICKYKFISQKQLQIFTQDTEDLLQLNTYLDQQNYNFQLYKQPNSHFQFSFNVSLSESLNQNKLELKVAHENITFELIKLNSQVKFVRNSLLNDMLSSSSQKSSKGLLTMDQSSRFLLESLAMPFPVIGFWLKNSSGLQSIQTIDHFVQFIKTEYQKRCVFKELINQKRKQTQCKVNESLRKEEKYFYFVRISEQKRMQTFIVSWSVKEPLTKDYQIKLPTKLIQIPCNSKAMVKAYDSIRSSNSSSPKQSSSLSSSQNNSSQSSLKSQQENGMDFTLRQEKHKRQLSTLQSLISYSYLSPIKQLETNQNQENLFSQTYQNSPQFSTLMKQDSLASTECVELKAKVKFQEEEIQKLKEIILEMQSQLKLYKNSRMSTHCESNRKKNQFISGISSPESNTFSLGSNQNSQSNSPQVAGRLRESDLKSNSVSHSGNWLKNSSNKKSLQSINQNLSGNKDSDWIRQDIPPLLEKEQKEQKLYEKLPEILQQDPRDPWDYMEIIQE